MQIITKHKNNLGIEQTSFKGVEYKRPKSQKLFRSWKDEIVTRFATGINKEREGTQYKDVTERVVAIRINKHPVLKESLQECEYLYKQCEKKHFGIFFWATK